VRLAYLGTPEIAVPPLDALIAAGHEIALVITRPDARRGRGASVSGSPVKVRAQELGLSVSHCVDDLIALARSGDLDLAVVVAFGEILRSHLLTEVNFINLHFSLLPRWRGAAPVERALLAGDQLTGVCVMQIEEGLDTGGVYACAEVPIGPETTAGELRARLVTVGSELLVRELAAGLGDPTPQSGEVSVAKKLSSEDLRIDWSASVEQIHRLIRIGGAWTTFRGARIKIHAARLEPLDPTLDSTELDRLQITRLQPEGKPQMDMFAWRNGVHLAPGEWFE
jgi:methionyl-tRNA formyltransferase